MIDVTCIIPARGESKRIPNKNIALLNGKPLITYSIEAWNKSKYRTRTAIVSTDNPDIWNIANVNCATTYLRPSVLAQDDTPTLPVIKHVIDTIEKYYQRRVQWILILQPTSPLRITEDIDNCLDIISNNQADSLTSVNPEGKENGAIYIMHSDLIAQGKLYGNNLYKYQMPAERSIDVDTLEDFKEAERIILKSDKSENKSGVYPELNVKEKRKKERRNVRK